MENNNFNNIDYNSNNNFGNQENMFPNGKMFFSVKPLIIFAIVLIILIIGSILIFGKIKKNRKEEKIKKSKIAASDPIITVKSNDNNAKLEIKVEHTEYLKTIAYSWNDDPGTEKSVSTGRNKEYTVKDVEIPLGTNTLTVVAKDENGTEGKYKNEFTNNLGKDIGKPEISFSLEKKGKNIKVNVKDNESLQKVVYRWNDEEEHEIELQEEQQTEVSFNVKIIPGKNMFYVIAKDKNGNESKRQREYEGIEAPTINFSAAPDGKSVILKVYHPLGVKSIEYKLNGEEFKSDEIQDGLTTVTVTIKLTKENNEIEAKATSADGVTSHPEVRSIKMPKREEIDDFGERVKSQEKEQTKEE